jgi:hypothetical protein|tara:strand:- start:41 stop:529 length:489 start_codon:yes stop_codon:yes gene_type:complete
MSEFRKALEKYAKYVIQQSRTNLTKKKNNSTKALYNSLEYKIQGDKVSFLSEKYGPFIDKGVRGAKGYYADQATAESPYKYTTKIPPAKPFEKWIKKNNIQGRDKKTGRFITQQSLSYIIARSVYSTGIRATLFFTKPFERGLDLYGDEIVAGYLEDKLDLQ